jgi:hypothetical protein
MSITNFRAAEPLYIVILRNQQAENLLRSWVRENKVEHANVTGNRMMLHHQQAFENFRITWAHDWELVTVWDTWHKRHIYI